MSNILIIEEDPGRAFLIKKALEIEAHQVTITNDILRLSHILSTHDVDLILVNHFIQNGSGWDVYHRIWKEDGTLPAMVYALSR
jgi:DNA-binding response OmpR family regulator